MRILLVEDERRLSNVVKKGLAEEGFAVDTAYDGEEGQYLAESENYDLIILDIMLPKQDGWQVLQQLLPLALQLCSALHYLAAERVVHLDVKPSNVIMGSSPRLIDFSIARMSLATLVNDRGEVGPSEKP